MALQLFAVTAAEHRAPEYVTTEQPVSGPPATVVFRDLAALVEEVEYESATPAGPTLERYIAVVDRAFNAGPVLPAPPATVFRTRDVLVRWLELHYVALTDALSYVEDRAVARVYMCREDGDPAERDKGSDLAAVAAEAFRALRRRAVAAIPLKTEHLTGIVLSGSFLVERELWRDFEETVRAERERNRGLRIDLTGPWAPFDFVQMQFGG